MDQLKIGKTISFLRKRAGYTQKDLADRIGISDKAVSKWERGIGLPEIGYLRKLSILLDTDTDSLLAGNAVHHDSGWSGIIVLTENVYGINSGTIIYDKPLINYLLSYFLLVGIKDITIVGDEADECFVASSLGTGDEYGIRITTVVGSLKDAVSSREWNGNLMLVYGRCFIYGVDQTRFFQKAMMNRDCVTMLVLPKKMRDRSTHINIDQNKKVFNANSDEPLKTQYDYSDIPILLFPAETIKEIAEEPDIPSFISDYSAKKELYVFMLDRGFVEIEIDDWNNVQEASLFMKIIQDKCGMNVYCLEEVAWRRGFISLKQLKMLGEKYRGNDYGDYILSLYHRFNSKQTEA